MLSYISVISVIIFSNGRSGFRCKTLLINLAAAAGSAAKTLAESAPQVCFPTGSAAKTLAESAAQVCFPTGSAAKTLAGSASPTLKVDGLHRS